MGFYDLFSTPKPLVGMVHLLPLSGSPKYGGGIDAIYERAESEAGVLVEAGMDAILIENSGDEPYLVGESPPEQLALMAGITSLISRSTNTPVGVNVQFNAWQAELAIAHTCGARFVRVEVFVDTVVSAQGMIAPCSAQVTRYRRMLGADDIQLWADIQTKYTTSLVPRSMTQSAKDACNAGADALIVTGVATGQATPLEAVAEVERAVDIPVVVGSGTSVQNVARVLEIADGAIVGSSLKTAGLATNPVSKDAVLALLQAAGR